MGIDPAILGPAAQAQIARKLVAENVSRETKPKYNNVSQVVDGHRFDSTREATRYLALKAEEARGKISHLRCQPAWRLEVNGFHVADYIADFSYRADNMLVVEDVKGGKATKTPEYRLKKKLLWACHRIHVQEVA